MARQTFFSFRYRKDNWRAGIVRKHLVTPEGKAPGFFDSAEWEDVKKKNDFAINKWINYEITASNEKGNGLLGIFIHQLRDKDKKTTIKGKNPFDDLLYDTKNGKKVYFSSVYKTYDWINDDGYSNMGDWIEKAAKDAGKY
jgi:hypothetical protein